MTSWFRGMVAFAAIAAGGFFVLSEVGYALAYATASDFAVVASTKKYQAASWVFLVGAALAMPALMGIHRHQAHRSGVFGLPAAVVLGMALAMVIGLAWTSTFVDPYLVAAAPELFLGTEAAPLQVGTTATYYAVIVGALSYAFVTWRAGVFPRWTAVLLALAGISIIGLPPGDGSLVPAGSVLVLGFAFVGFGLALHDLMAASDDDAAAAALDDPERTEPEDPVQ